MYLGHGTIAAQCLGVLPVILNGDDFAFVCVAHGDLDLACGRVLSHNGEVPVIEVDQRLGGDDAPGPADLVLGTDRGDPSQGCERNEDKSDGAYCSDHFVHKYLLNGSGRPTPPE